MGATTFNLTKVGRFDSWMLSKLYTMKFINFLHKIRPVINASQIGVMIGRPQSLLSMYTAGGRPMSERNQYDCAIAIASKTGAIQVGGKYFTEHSGKLFEVVPARQQVVSEVEFNQFCNTVNDSRIFLSVFHNVALPVGEHSTTFHVVGEIRNGEEFLFIAKDPIVSFPEQYNPVYLADLKDGLLESVENAIEAAQNGEVPDEYLIPEIIKIIEFWGKNRT